MPPKPRHLWTVAAPQSEVGSSVSLTGFGGSKPVVLNPAVLAPHTASSPSLLLLLVVSNIRREVEEEEPRSSAGT